jgi:RNA-binding protein YlmH
MIKLKAITLKSCIEINEIKKSNEERLNTHKSKLKSIKQTIIVEDNKKINILKQNEKILSDKCDIIFNVIKANLYLNKFEIDDQRKNIENNELNETELTNLNMRLDEIKQNINNNSKHIEEKIIELQKVILNAYFDF